MSDQAKETPADKLKREKAELEAAKADAAAKEIEAARAAAIADIGDEEEKAADVEADDVDPMADAKEAHKRLETIALSYPLTTPDEHTVFGFGGHVFKLGHLRALFNLKRS